MNNLTCWIITEGMAGTENQCLGVAESLGVTPDIKRITLTQPWKSLSPFMGFERARTFTPPLAPPWPDLLIASGRKSIAASRYIKKMSGGKTFTVQIQDPRVNPAQFDLVAVPAHDRLRGRNVIVTDAAPNRITPAKLEEAKAQFQAFEKLKAPRLAVLIGGDSHAHKLTPAIMETLATQLKALSKTHALMITTSRRTGAQNESLLREALKNTNAYIWDGQGNNPYFGMLGWADYILVTSDSTSMLSDAATTGKPLYMIPLEGGSARFERLYAHLKSKGALRNFTKELDTFSYSPINDTELIANEIKAQLKTP